MITIIVPIYNAEKTLSRCIDSIINQSQQDFELILINDGSTDSSKEICEKYLPNSRIRLFSTENKGVSAARNLGLKQATGNWILFVDSDDYLEPQTLFQYEKFISLENVYYIQDYYIDMPHLQWKVDFSKKDKSYSIYETMNILMTRYHNSMGYIWHCLFSKCIIDKHKIRFNETLSFGEDAVFAFEYIQYMEKGQFIPYNGYHYCDINPQSLTKTSKATPTQNYVLIENIVKSITVKIQNSNKIDIIQIYIINILLRNLTSLNKQNLSTRQEYYAKYGTLILNHTKLFHHPQSINLLSRIVKEGYSDKLAYDLLQYQRKIKIKKHVFYHRIIDKLYNILH